MDWKQRADELLDEFLSCCKAKPMNDVVNIQLYKDSVAECAYHLATQRGWGTENEIEEACLQFEPLLKQLKEKVVIEILQNGTI